MLTRRKFMTHSCSLGVATATASSTLLQLGLARNAAAQTATDYRALVCVLLAGGNDSFNMLIPGDSDQYSEYAAIRSDLALPSDGLLALNGTTLGGRSYSLHPGMSELQQLYNSGEAAMVANVGTLLEAFDPQSFVNGSASLPLGLFSHADQISQWQTAMPDARAARGWGGRIADLMQGVNVQNGISQSITLSGTNTFQAGNQTSEYSVTSEDNGVNGIYSYDDGTPYGELKKQMLDQVLGVTHSNLLRREYSQRIRKAIDTNAIFGEAMNLAPQLLSAFSENEFSRSLRQIARIISIRDILGAQRQTFFITVGGWDHHDDTISQQAAMLPMISRGLKEFRDALVELSVFDDVATFTISDFGRTLTSNGKGSDHGWGGHHIVMGGGVQGGQIVGEYPELMANSPLDVGRGVYAPTTAVDEYFAELALWFGVSPSDLELVLPNVSRFYTPSLTSSPLGFLPTA